MKRTGCEMMTAFKKAWIFLKQEAPFSHLPEQFRPSDDDGPPCTLCNYPTKQALGNLACSNLNCNAYGITSDAVAEGNLRNHLSEEVMERIKSGEYAPYRDGSEF
tara:strand:+ start:222 stop:536 length:315 start_codon:yes stop_codon:yes gene_type:complete